jgi:hypothetical protein
MSALLALRNRKNGNIIQKSINRVELAGLRLSGRTIFISLHVSTCVRVDTLNRPPVTIYIEEAPICDASSNDTTFFQPNVDTKVFVL